MGVLLQNDHPVGGISADVIEDINFDLTTNAKNLPGAINELNGKSSTTVSVTQAEYDALPSSKLTDDIAYYIKDGVPDVDNALWNKVGTTTLETTAKDCSGAINELNSSKVNKINTQLTLTRTANNYVDAASFARLAAVRKDNVLFFICNLALSSSIPASALSDFVEIGRISGWSSAYTIMQQIPSQQSDGNSLSIRVTSNGIVSIYAVKAASSWYRTVVSIPASN